MFNNQHSENYASHPTKKCEGFIRKCVDIILNLAVYEGTNRRTKVIDWQNPEELKKLFDFKLRPKPETHEELLDILKQTIQYSVKTGHPYFINQLYSGLDPYALIGQWLTDALNPSVYTYEVAPVFTLMEEEVLSEMRRIIGFPNNGFGDGVFCPGGSIANGYAISCARFKKFPELKKLAVFMGFGSNNVWKIRTNHDGRMDTESLKNNVKKSLSDGCMPLMVAATAGTTVLGAFDDLIAIADICEEYHMWMHVDAAWGGGALISRKYRHLLQGIDRSDSVTWNPHKLLTASQQCSTFSTRHKNILNECHSSNASYLFQKDKFYNTAYDTGDKHIQCGRRADVFKFWFMWKAKGTTGLEKHIDKVFGLAKYFAEELKKRPGFELVLENPQCTNICFWYIPPSLREIPRDDEFLKNLNKIAPKIKEQMMKKGSMMITYQPLGCRPNFFRLVLQNSYLDDRDMLFFLDEIENIGKNI